MIQPCDMLVTFDVFLDEVHPTGDLACAAARVAEVEERKGRSIDFPYDVVLQLAYPQVDFANRWCWQQFGPAHGECLEYSSEYPACLEKEKHRHEGRWLTHWLAKTDYDFGFNEWRFVQQADRDKFLAFVPHITWGENFPD